VYIPVNTTLHYLCHGLGLAARPGGWLLCG
jgi:hypothetical protein